MPKVIAQTIARDTMNAAAEAKTGWQRAASHSRSGNSRATGITVFQGSGGSDMIIPVIAATSASATLPSMIMLRRGGSRTAEPSPITRGATVMMPSASDANHCRQVVRIGPVGLWNKMYATVAGTPEIAVA